MTAKWTAENEIGFLDFYSPKCKADVERCTILIKKEMCSNGSSE